MYELTLDTYQYNATNATLVLMTVAAVSFDGHTCIIWMIKKLVEFHNNFQKQFLLQANSF